MSEQFDVIIIGGGLVGATLALALAPLGLKVALIESQAEKHFQFPELEVRSLALAYGGAKIFQGMGLWQDIVGQATAIHSIHVSDRGQFGKIRLSANEAGVPALGYVVEIPVLLSILYQQLAHSSVKQFSPATLLSLEQDCDQVNISIKSGEAELGLSAKLVLGADGGKSTVRNLLQIDAQEHDYQQLAIVANIMLKRAHCNLAFERFTDQGPLALLPLPGKRMSLIWTVKNSRADELLSKSDKEFLAHLQKIFGYKAGRFEAIGNRQSYPLKQLQVNTHYRGRVGLIGNSAHSLHPVAGQGFNLSLRDIAELACIIGETPPEQLNETVFERYIHSRESDHHTMLKLTDGLVKIFSTQNILWSLPRNVGLYKVERLPQAKSELNTLMMGLRGRLNRLSRGLPVKRDETHDNR